MSTDLSELEVFGEVRANDFTDTVDGFHAGIIEIVDDGDMEAVMEKLNHRVSADEAGTAGDQNLLLRRG